MSEPARTLLLVDDSPEDRILYRRFLRNDPQYQFDFVEAETGAEGLAVCRQRSPDLILLDYRLPDMDGLEFIEIYRKEHPKFGDRLPIFLLTGQEEEEIAALATEARVLAYLIKGELTRESLSQSVRAALEASDRVRLSK